MFSSNLKFIKIILENNLSMYNIRFMMLLLNINNDFSFTSRLVFDEDKLGIKHAIIALPARDDEFSVKLFVETFKLLTN